jgi:hypothetical protein
MIMTTSRLRVIFAAVKSNVSGQAANAPGQSSLMLGQLFKFDLQLLKCPVLEISYFDRACQPLNKRRDQGQGAGKSGAGSWQRR